MRLDVTTPGPLMRFTDGLVLRGTDCPRGILSRSHWVFTEGLPFDGVNSRCLCGAIGADGAGADSAPRMGQS